MNKGPRKNISMFKDPNSSAHLSVHLKWWLIDKEGKTVSDAPVSWDRLRFCKYKQLILDTDYVCPDKDGVPNYESKITLKDLMNFGSSHVSEDNSLEREFCCLGEELLVHEVGYRNTRPCPLEFLTKNKLMAWEMDGLQIPRIGCRNYWVAGKAGGSSEWSE